MADVAHFRELRVWQAGMSLVRDIYGATAKFPSGEQYGITSQVRRAAVSIPSNIAEGWCRKHRKEYAQYLNIACGSTGEFQTLIEMSRDLGYLPVDLHRSVDERIEHIRAMILTLVRRLK